MCNLFMVNEAEAAAAYVMSHQFHELEVSQHFQPEVRELMSVI
jgi:hypothetical protein